MAWLGSIARSILQLHVHVDSLCDTSQYSRSRGFTRSLSSFGFHPIQPTIFTCSFNPVRPIAKPHLILDKQLFSGPNLLLAQPSLPHNLILDYRSLNKATNPFAVYTHLRVRPSFGFSLRGHGVCHLSSSHVPLAGTACIYNSIR